ncbi:phenol degradation protein [Marinobacterium zhoushanense]|uniref:Phenol degradation protein n=1 Tax=Marinobacterium zhoushanense TaxID=1679163 RepID=A0ABQ1K3Q9_9GAMM|nr:transporter [Marinobacterium zhoushanense]GGB86978.1 phenol degradation protein [Marinobacterium zhoushanense]
MTVCTPTKLTLAATIAMLCSSNVLATEGGGSNYPMGAENYLMGALPPPGVYPLIYAQHYSADEFKDGSGDSLPIDFDLEANVLAPRLVWVTDKTILGGQLFAAALLPLVDLDVSVNGFSQSNKGVGDLDLTAALSYHHSPNLHSAVGFDLFVPTGEYDKNDLANIGRNYWALQAVYAASLVNPTGLNADVKFMYDYNFENDDTNYKSGQEFHFDYAVGWGVSPNWTVGVGGYGYKQVTGDEVNGVDIGNKGQAFAFGPSIKYDNGKGFFLSVKYQKEFAVENRPEGDALWIKTIIPF